MASSLDKKKIQNDYITICANCSNLKITETQWITTTKDFKSQFALNGHISHGICPRCMKVLYGDLFSEDIAV